MPRIPTAEELLNGATLPTAEELLGPEGPRLPGSQLTAAPEPGMRETLGNVVRTVGGLASGFPANPLIRLLGGGASELTAQVVEGGKARAGNALQATLPPMGQTRGGISEDTLFEPELAVPPTTILEQHKNKNFVQRILQPQQWPQLDLGNGQVASHKMMWGELDGPQGKIYRVFPSVVYDPSAKALKALAPEKAWDYATKTGEFIDFPTADEADAFSKNYKEAWTPEYGNEQLTQIAEDARSMKIKPMVAAAIASSIGFGKKGDLVDRLLISNPELRGLLTGAAVGSVPALSEGRMPTMDEVALATVLGGLGGAGTRRQSEGGLRRQQLSRGVRAAQRPDSAPALSEQANLPVSTDFDASGAALDRIPFPLEQGIDDALSPSPTLPGPEDFDYPGAALRRLPGQRFYRQASTSEVQEYFTSGDKYPVHTFLADDPTLALGQGTNKSGLLVEFGAMPGVRPQSTKPGSEFVQAQGGGGEYTIRAARENLGQHVRSITIPEKMGEREVRSERRGLLAILQRDGWQPTKNADGSTQWTRPQAADPSPLTDSFRAGQALKGEKGAINLQLLFAAGRTAAGGVAGGAGGYAMGDTPEERKRYAIEGALAGGAALGLGGSPTVGKMLKRFAAADAPPIKLAPEVEGVADKLGAAARDVEYFKSMGLFADMHKAADEAWFHLDKLKALADAGAITPENRLYKVVNKIVFPEGGADATRNLESWANTGRIMQRYSALAKALRQEAAKDPEAAATLRILYGEKDATTPFGMAMHWYRGSLIGRVSTAAKNIYDQAATVGVNAGDRFWEQAVQGHPIGGLKDAGNYLTQPLTNMARSARRGGDTVQNLIARTGAVQRAPVRTDPIDGVLAHFTDEAAKLTSKPEGLAPAIAKMGPRAQKWAGGMEAWTQLNAKLNDVQEGFFRRSVFEADLRNSLRHEGMNADAALANPGMIPERLVKQATARALKSTFAKDPIGANQPGILAKGVVNLFRENPGLYLVHPFPRYMMNRIEYFYEHSPVGLLELAQRTKMKGRFEKIITENTPLLKDAATKERALFNIKSAQEGLGNLTSKAEIWGKAINGSLLPLLAALTLRNDALAGEKWWLVKAGDKRIDMRPEATMAMPMFLAEVIKQFHKHGRDFSKWTMTEEDRNNAVALFGTRAGVGMTLVDMFTGRNNAGGGFWNFVADAAAAIPSGFFNPIEQWHGPIGMAEEALGYDPQELIRRDTKGNNAMDRAWMPVAKQIPILGSRFVPGQANPTGPSPKKNEFPLAQFFGVQMAQPNAAEKLLMERGYPPSTLYPDAGGDREWQRHLTAESGPLVQELIGRLTQDPRFRTASPAQQNLMIDDELAESKRRAMGRMPPAAQEMIRRQRMPKHQQELLREQGR